MYGEEVEKYNLVAKERGLPQLDPDSIDPSVQAFRDMERDLQKKGSPTTIDIRQAQLTNTIVTALGKRGAGSGVDSAGANKPKYAQ
ncbi:hypothetical protein HDU98_012220, partial [Podochytrium sp. JEL0797]